jgi:FkbM family methyltransferase
MRTKFYTKNNQLIDISSWDTSGNASDLGNRYGWEGAMAYGNLINDELNTYGPGVEYGDIYLDLGANIGMSALRAESRGCSKLYCIEPDPGVFDALNKNKNYNWVVDNIAIGAEKGYIDIQKWPNWWETQPIQCITLDEFFAKHNLTKVDYMKCDIEGCEKYVFKNVSQVTWDKIQKIFFEYHEDVEKISPDQLNKEREDFINFFVNKGFNNHYIHLGYHQSWIYFWKS